MGACGSSQTLPILEGTKRRISAQRCYVKCYSIDCGTPKRKHVVYKHKCFTSKTLHVNDTKTWDQLTLEMYRHCMTSIPTPVSKGPPPELQQLTSSGLVHIYQTHTVRTKLFMVL